MGLELFENNGAVRAGRHKDLGALSDERLIEGWQRLLRQRAEVLKRGQKESAFLVKEQNDYTDEITRRAKDTETRLRLEKLLG